VEQQRNTAAEISIRIKQNGKQQQRRPHAGAAGGGGRFSSEG